MDAGPLRDLMESGVLECVQHWPACIRFRRKRSNYGNRGGKTVALWTLKKAGLTCRYAGNRQPHGEKSNALNDEF